MTNSKYCNPTLYNAIQTFTKKAFDHFVKQQKEEIPVISEYRWVKGQNGTYHRKMVDRVHFAALLHRDKYLLRKLNEFQECQKVLCEDPEICKQIGLLVGTSEGKRLFESEDLIFGCINRMLRDNRSDEFETELFENEYYKIEKALYQNEIECCVIVPIYGFYSDENIIKLSKEIEIVRFSEDEILSYLNSGLILGRTFDGDYLSDLATFGIKTTYYLPKIIGEQDFKDNKCKKNRHELLNWKTVVDLLRVFKKGEIYQAGMIRATNSFFQLGKAVAPAPNLWPAMIINAFQLCENEIDEFKLFLQQNEKFYIGKKSFLKIANRKFSQAVQRTQLDDKILDFFICAEALFLGSGTEGRLKGELNYRLSHRAAVLLTRDNHERRRIFHFMKMAYDLRSRIIHGDVPKLPKRQNGKPYRIDLFIEDLEDFLRDSLKKAIIHMHKNQCKKIDWDSLLFI